eukprot:CAMPEP_0172311790 /NCGR_PEP_ID=MMETSP1058-20130122/15777_1 /TAXON_ID=83371 /ORGANISM="Detonula confervacea, Strain CCMP 353" /LENGTH=718 /DNA_ID=CAMNT_0013025081 /DNA_START=122 /DNA_END=2275 /DNA_ORIENTATION=-
MTMMTGFASMSIRQRRRAFVASIVVVFFAVHVMKGQQQQHQRAPSALSQPSQPSHQNNRNMNLHAAFPIQCGQLPQQEQANTSVLSKIYDIILRDAPFAPKYRINFNPVNHNPAGFAEDPTLLYQTQVCSYENLARWNVLSQQLNISDWALHGGAAMGGKCFGAMNPWDDDIDLTIGNCSALDSMWDKAERNISKSFPHLDEGSYSMNNSGAIWDPRLIEGDLLLIKGDKCCPWYKFMTIKEASMWKKGSPITGIDMECMDRGLSAREGHTKRKSGWREHMENNRQMLTIPYGPTTAKMVPPIILNKYIAIRYGKRSPCRFPFENGVDEDPPLSEIAPSSTYRETSTMFQLDQDRASMEFALQHWYVPKEKRLEWKKNAGNMKQMEYTAQIPNLDTVEVDNSISPQGCSWGRIDDNSTATIKVIGWNAERGKHWDKFYTLIQKMEELRLPHVVLLNEMDIGMARSRNVHTARQLALELGMNYAYGVEFLELTRGTKEEQDATENKRDALSLHGNALLTKCILGDAMILRDELPHTYFSDKAHRGVNANGYEVRLGGRMGLFARIFESPHQHIPLRHNNNNRAATSIATSVDSYDYQYLEDVPPHFVVGNIHKLDESDVNQARLWNYYGFGNPPPRSSKYDGKGEDKPIKQLGVVIQGDFGPKMCPLGGLVKMNNGNHKTFRVNCLADGKVKIGPLAGDYFCTNMPAVRGVAVTAPCDW